MMVFSCSTGCVLHHAVMKNVLLMMVVSLGALLPVRAAETKKPDPFEEALRDAVKEYRAGKIDKVRESMARATKVLDERLSGKVVDTFPEAPEGWIAGDVENAEIPQVFGGGKTIRKNYRQKEGKKEILLEVICDSSYGKLMMGLLASDAVAEGQGYKVEKIGADRVLLKGAELHMPVEDRILVKLTAKGGADDKDMLKLARYLDRSALRKVK